MKEKKEQNKKISNEKNLNAKSNLIAHNKSTKKPPKSNKSSVKDKKTKSQQSKQVIEEKKIPVTKDDLKIKESVKDENNQALTENSENVVSSKKENEIKTPEKRSNHIKKGKPAKEKKVKDKDKKEKKPLTKKQIVLISSISAAVLVVALTVILCIVLIKPAKAPDYPILSAIEVKVASKTTGYKAFDEFDDDGLILTATYSDESTKEIYEGWTIVYISQDGLNETTHSDYLYGGETKVKIEYFNKSCYLTIDEVAKVESELDITLERHSQIYTGNVINIPGEKIKIADKDGAVISGAIYELFYCKTFNSFDDYELTSSDDGASVEGGVPTKIGTYQVFAKLVGDKNYLDKLSNVVEFNIIDETQTGLFALEGESFFAWKEQSIPVPIDPTYIEFELVSENNQKFIKYYSTFAGDGITFIYSDGIELVCNNEKTQIHLENKEISIVNSQIKLKKWEIPAYLGTYERVVTPQYVANNFNLTLNQEETCKLKIYIDDTLKDGKVYFTYDLLWRNGETLSMQRIEGFVTYSESQSGEGNLAFNISDGEIITNLFTINDVSENNRLSSINILVQGVFEAAVSNGEYQRII